MAILYKRGCVMEVRYIGNADELHWAGPQPRLRDALEVCERVYREEAQKDLVVTELFGGRHQADSFHYIGLAADLRTNSLREDVRQAVIAELEKALRPVRYVVIYEGNHAHIEPADPRSNFPLILGA